MVAPSSRSRKLHWPVALARACLRALWSVGNAPARLRGEYLHRVGTASTGLWSCLYLLSATTVSHGARQKGGKTAFDGLLPARVLLLRRSHRSCSFAVSRRRHVRSEELRRLPQFLRPGCATRSHQTRLRPCQRGQLRDLGKDLRPRIGRRDAAQASPTTPR